MRQNFVTMNRLLTACIVLLFVSMSEKVFAFGMPTSMPLSQTIEQSTMVAIVSMVDFVPGAIPPDSGIKLPEGGMVYVGPSIFTSRPMKPAGHYVFHVLKTLKGSPGPTIDVDLPAVLYMYYGGAGFDIEKGSILIIYLRGSTGDFSPTDTTVPFVPLTAGSLTGKTDTGDIQDEVVNLMLVSCSNATIRLANIFLLRTVTNPRIVTGLFPYIDDANILTRDNVLCCMAANQQAAAIPRIAALQTQTMSPDKSTQSVLSLGNFRTLEAVPYLNPLLFSPAYYVRINTMTALNRLADSTSIPYLMLAVRDPDVQRFIPQSAYGLLHQIIPSLGPAYGDFYFSQHRSVEAGKLNAWWDDELLGKHLKSGEHASIPSMLPSDPSQLNPKLFTPDTAFRRTVAAKLSSVGDASSIPYLVLALQDPDNIQTDANVSYVAYKTLHRLILLSNHAESFDAYLGDRNIANESIYDWWQDYLDGKHPEVRGKE